MKATAKKNEERDGAPSASVFARSSRGKRRHRSLLPSPARMTFEKKQTAAVSYKLPENCLLENLLTAIVDPSNLSNSSTQGSLNLYNLNIRSIKNRMNNIELLSLPPFPPLVE